VENLENKLVNERRKDKDLATDPRCSNTLEYACGSRDAKNDRYDRAAEEVI
jgi:hypothetical protein